MKKDVIIKCYKTKKSYIVTLRNINTSGQYSKGSLTNLLDSYAKDGITENGLVSSEIWDFSQEAFVESCISVNHLHIDVKMLLTQVVSYYLLRGELLDYNFIFDEEIVDTFQL